jgi:RNA polymerase sigma-32 factor
MGKELVPKKNTLPIPALSDTDGLDSYIRFASSIPMLSEEEEKELAHRLRQQNDIDAAQKLILSHLRFVVKVARGFSGYGLPITDLIQEGNIGLMKAVRRFDPDVGVRLVSFAVHWVKAEMHDYILKNWRIVKIATTKAQRKLFFNLRSSKERLGWFSDEEIQSVAKELGVKPETVLEMEKRMNAYDMAFDAPVEESGDESSFHPALYLEDQSRNPEQTAVEDDYEEKVQGKLQEAIDKLDARSKDIILSRWFAEDKLTLHDLAAKHDVSAERIRQIEELAMDKLKRAVARV